MGDFWGNWHNDYDYKAPALVFEKRAGLTGIGKHYVMPPDHDMQSLEIEIRRRVQWCDIPLRERHRRAREYAGILTALNPELKQVKYDRRKLINVWHFILGTTSGFNPADINYFINAGRDELVNRNHNARVEKHLGPAFNRAAGLGWRPSAPTADLIISKLDAKLPKPRPL